MKRIISIALILILSLSITACEKATTASKKITVAVSIVPQATFVEKVCGDKVNIVTLIPSGASAESYELKPKEITAFADSKTFFSIGVPAEEHGILPNLSENTNVIDLSKAVSEEYPDRQINGEPDPHIWLSPKRVQVMIRTIAKEMCLLDPENSDFYNKNADSYLKELENLNTEILDIFKAKIRRKFLVYHPAFGYFADDYGLEMYALEEHGHEATPKDLTEMTDLAKRENIKVIFCQAEASDKQARAFAEEIGGRVQILEPLSPDYISNLKKTATLINEAVTG